MYAGIIRSRHIMYDGFASHDTVCRAPTRLQAAVTLLWALIALGLFANRGKTFITLSQRTPWLPSRRLFRLFEFLKKCNRLSNTTVPNCRQFRGLASFEHAVAEGLNLYIWTSISIRSRQICAMLKGHPMIKDPNDNVQESQAFEVNVHNEAALKQSI